MSKLGILSDNKTLLAADSTRRY